MVTIVKDDINSVLSLVKYGESSRKVSKITGISRQSIDRIVKKYLPQLKRSKGGRPAVLSTSDKRYCVYSITKRGQENTVQVADVLKEVSGKILSVQTVRNALRESGMGSMEKIEKPFLRKANISKRLDWAKRHKDWTVEGWHRVVWSDETKIKCFNSDGRTWSWIRDNETLQARNIKQTVKHGGGSIMIWNCISATGVGWMCKIDSIMTKEVYLDILQTDLKESIEDTSEGLGLKLPQIYFQQDNDLKHSAKFVKIFIQAQEYLWCFGGC